MGHTSGFPVLHHLPEFAQPHVRWVSDAIQPSHPLFPPSLPALNLSHHQGLFQGGGSSHQEAKYWNFSFSIPWGGTKGPWPFALLWLFSFVSACSHFSDETYSLAKIFAQTKGQQRTREEKERGVLLCFSLSPSVFCFQPLCSAGC